MNIKRKDLQNLQFCKSLILMSLSFVVKLAQKRGLAGKTNSIRNCGQVRCFASVIDVKLFTMIGIARLKEMSNTK